MNDCLPDVNTLAPYSGNGAFFFGFKFKVSCGFPEHLAMDTVTIQGRSQPFPSHTCTLWARTIQQ